MNIWQEPNRIRTFLDSTAQALNDADASNPFAVLRTLVDIADQIEFLRQEFRYHAGIADAGTPKGGDN
jgi:hypothetical protein